MKIYSLKGHVLGQGFSDYVLSCISSLKILIFEATDLFAHENVCKIWFFLKETISGTWNVEMFNRLLSKIRHNTQRAIFDTYSTVRWRVRFKGTLWSGMSLISIRIKGTAMHKLISWLSRQWLNFHQVFCQLPNDFPSHVMVDPLALP